MNAPTVIFPQLDVLRRCSVAEARDLGVSRERCWDSAWELLRLCGELRKGELIDLLSFAYDRLDNVEAKQCVKEALEVLEDEPRPSWDDHDSYDRDDQYV